MSQFGAVGRRLIATNLLSLNRLKWFAIVAPLLALVVMTSLLRSSLHDWLHTFPGILFIDATFAVLIFLFASAIFGLIEDLEQRVVAQNRELSALVARTDHQNAELSALLAVGRAATSSVELEEMLEEALDAILAVTPATRAEVWLPDHRGLRLSHARGLSADQLSAHHGLGEPLPDQAFERGTLLVAREPYLGAEGVGQQTLCALPLRQGDEALGVLLVVARAPAAFEQGSELRLLEGIGEQMSLALANARLHTRVLDRAVIEERERLSRELHDGLAQVLGYINTQALAVKRHVEAGESLTAVAELDTMTVAAREVYGDVRDAIVGLRAGPPGLIPTIRNYLNHVRDVVGCTIELHASEEAGSVELAASTEIQLLRIVQEALSNVRKHAEASHVDVWLRLDGPDLEVEIDDDGRGLETEARERTGWPRLGLQTMNERALAIGGTLTITPRSPRGTRVLLRVPVDVNGRSAGARPAC